MYAILAIFFVSAVVVLVGLDRLQMRVARNLFLLLTVVLFLYIPMSIWCSGMVFFYAEQTTDNLVLAVFAFLEKAIDFSNIAFLSITVLTVVLAIIVSAAMAIVVVSTAKAICKIVKGLQKKQREAPKHPQKQNYHRRLVHTKIQYKSILYLRFCRLNS